MSKYVIKNCPAILKMSKVCDDYRTTRENPQLCKNIADCVMKKIVEKCREAHGQIVGYEKGKIYDGKNLIEAELPLATINPLAKEILNLLQIEECE